MSKAREAEKQLSVWMAGLDWRCAVPPASAAAPPESGLFHLTCLAVAEDRPSHCARIDQNLMTSLTSKPESREHKDCLEAYYSLRFLKSWSANASDTTSRCLDWVRVSDKESAHVAKDRERTLCEKIVASKGHPSLELCAQLPEFGDTVDCFYSIREVLGFNACDDSAPKFHRYLCEARSALRQESACSSPLCLAVSGGGATVCRDEGANLIAPNKPTVPSKGSSAQIRELGELVTNRARSAFFELLSSTQTAPERQQEVEEQMGRLAELLIRRATMTCKLAELPSPGKSSAW